MQYALIQDGIVRQLFAEYPYLADDPDAGLLVMQVTDDVRPRWRLIDGTAMPPPAPSPAELLAYAADKRWQVETGGLVAGGATIATDRESQAMITGAYAYAQANPAGTIKFKAPGGFVTLDAATMSTIAIAVAAHVQACFAAEADVVAAIEAGTVTTIAEIEAWEWSGGEG